mgnify:CR=1 FL=1|jgi:hypothetical protein
MLKLEVFRRENWFTRHEREILMFDEESREENGLMQFIQDVGPVLERLGEALEYNTELSNLAYEFAGRAEAIAEGK